MDIAVPSVPSTDAGGVETNAPVPATAAPRLGSMGTGPVVCPPPPGECTGENEGRCCPNDLDCSYKRCVFAGQTCRDDTCFGRCDVDADCALVPGADPAVELICGAEKLCVPRGCTSNRGCEVGRVCQGAEDAGICVAATFGEPDPECAASPPRPETGSVARARPGLPNSVSCRNLMQVVHG